MKKLTKIKFHGELGEHMGKEYNLSVDSVKEALQAVNKISGKKLSKYFMKDGNFHNEYRILVNGKDLASKHKKIDSVDKVNSSEIVIERKNLDTIDIVPVIQGSGNNFLAILLVVVAVVLIATGVGAAGFGAFMAQGATQAGLSTATTLGIGAGTAKVAGLGLLAAGISVLLSKPPEFAAFQDTGTAGGRRSYLFNGPENVQGEGRAVPFGYGRLKIGSQSIDATYEITYADADTNPLTS
jgi:predicted phage tail protein